MNNIKEQFGNVSAKYDSQRQYLIPCFNEFYTAALPLVKSLTHARTVLDIGAGTGLFSQFILDINPHLQFTLADFSDQMLDVARERFREDANFEFIELDFAKDPLPGKFDLIISALAIHHLDDHQKAALYKRIYKALNDGGLFINADQVAGRSLQFDSLYKFLWREKVSHSGLHHDDIVGAFERTKLDKFATLEDQLIWLKDAGFADVDCIYKNLNFAVFGGYKDEDVETAVI